MTTTYSEFLKTKCHFDQMFGVPIDPSDIHPILKSHQRDVVTWAVRKGRAAIFAAFGLGKSVMQIEIASQFLRSGAVKRFLIICPLGVRAEFRRDAKMLGAETAFVRRSDEVSTEGIYLTNYESVRDGKLDVSLFDAVSLDEASILRSYGSKTYQTFLTLFDSVPYRFVATATPSPNRYKEIIHYAGFLGIMDTGQALTRFFQRDSEKANNLTLYPHMEEEFYTWLHSWALFLLKPSQLGYSDEGYDLPELRVIPHEIAAASIGGHFERDGQGQLIKDAALGLQDASREKRDGISVRIDTMCEILRSDPENHYILWHDLEAERHAIRQAWPDAARGEIFGTLDLDVREDRIQAFAEGTIPYLSTKPELSGSGCNLQRHCHKAIFLGIGYQFNDFIQSVHRIQRFQQAHPCEIHIIYTETEREVYKTLMRKWELHNELVTRMGEQIARYGLSVTGLEKTLERKIGCTRQEARGARYTLVNNDSVEECRAMADNSVDLIVTSVPFGNHYEYSASYNDFGHNTDNDAFFAQMDFLTPELLRILKPGRLACIHTKDRIRFGNVTGYGMPTVEPFHADCLYHYRRHGFAYMGMITVVTDVVRENNQTYRLGWTENCKDGSKMGVGSPEYVLLFRKLPSDTGTAYADTPVTKSKTDYSRARWQIDAHAYWRSSGNRLLTAEEFKDMVVSDLVKRFPARSAETIYDHAAHVAIGEERGDHLPATFMSIAPGSWHEDVWTDVQRMRTLNGQQSQKGLVNHICPLQFDIVDRLIERYSMPGEIVFDPFGGLGTIPYCAVKLNRIGQSCELNPEYWQDSLRYLRVAEIEASAPSLFDLENLCTETKKDVVV